MRKSATVFAAMAAMIRQFKTNVGQEAAVKNKWKAPLTSGLLAIALLAIPLSATAAQKINRVNFLPVIDGDISEWIAMSPTPDLRQADFTSTYGEVLGLVPESDQKVEAWLGWDEKANLIYIAARVTDNLFGTTSSIEADHVPGSDDIFAVDRAGWRGVSSPRKTRGNKSHTVSPLPHRDSRSA